jgi:signal transduction histidine kinase
VNLTRTEPVQDWTPPRGGRGVAAVLAVATLLAGGAGLVYLTGGTMQAYVHVLYVPVVLAAGVFGIAGGVVAGLAAGVTVGPWMPLDVAAGVMQPTGGWLLRLGFFTSVGVLAGASRASLGRSLRDAQRLWESERTRQEMLESLLIDAAVERNRLALHVHDDVLPQLVAAGWCCEAAAAALASDDTSQTAAEVRRAKAATDAAVAELRQVLTRLHDATVEPGGLRGAVEDAADMLRRRDIDIDLVVRTRERRLPFPVEALVGGSVRGCVANVLEHADAERVRITVEDAEEGLAVTVTDDGAGFDAAGVTAQSGHGLALMRQRLRLAGGDLSVRSEPGSGTTVSMCVPLQESAGGTSKAITNHPDGTVGGAAP